MGLQNKYLKYNNKPGGGGSGCRPEGGDEKNGSHGPPLWYQCFRFGRSAGIGGGRAPYSAGVAKVAR